VKSDLEGSQGYGVPAFPEL